MWDFYQTLYCFGLLWFKYKTLINTVLFCSYYCTSLALYSECVIAISGLRYLLHVLLAAPSPWVSGDLAGRELRRYNLLIWKTQSVFLYSVLKEGGRKKNVHVPAEVARTYRQVSGSVFYSFFFLFFSFFCLSPSVYSTGSPVGLFVNQRDLIQQ